MQDAASSQAPQTQGALPPKKRKPVGLLITLAIMAAVVVLFIFNSPRGYDTSLKKVGDGLPALVLVFDPNSVLSGETMRVLDEIRPQLEAKMHFLVADIGRIEAQIFCIEHQVQPHSLLIFSGEGKQLANLQGAVTAEQVMEAVRGALGG